MIAFATIGRFCDEVMVVSAGTTRPEALALADKFVTDRRGDWDAVTDRRGDWDADADRETWLDSLEILELRGDLSTLRRLIGLAVYGVETTCTGEIARALNPHTKQEP